MDFDFNAVRDIFMNPRVTDDYKIDWTSPDIESMIKFLCGEHDFSENRVKKAANNLSKFIREFSQKDLSAWF